MKPVDHIRRKGDWLSHDQLLELEFTDYRLAKDVEAGHLVRTRISVCRAKPTVPVFDSSKTPLGTDGIAPAALERALRSRNEGEPKPVWAYHRKGHRIDLAQATHAAQLGDVYVRTVLERPELTWFSDREWPRFLGVKPRGHVLPDAVLLDSNRQPVTFVDAVTSSYRTDRLSALASYASDMNSDIQLW